MPTPCVLPLPLLWLWHLSGCAEVTTARYKNSHSRSIASHLVTRWVAHLLKGGSDAVQVPFGNSPQCRVYSYIEYWPNNCQICQAICIVRIQQHLNSLNLGKHSSLALTPLSLFRLSIFSSICFVGPNRNKVEKLNRNVLDDICFEEAWILLHVDK